MFKRISYGIILSKTILKTAKGLMDGQGVDQVLTDFNATILEARYSRWPEAVQKQLADGARFSGKLLLVIGQVRLALKSGKLETALDLIEKAARRKMAEDITLAADLETVGPRQAAINMMENLTKNAEMELN